MIFPDKQVKMLSFTEEEVQNCFCGSLLILSIPLCNIKIKIMKNINEITGTIIGKAIEAHRHPGAGLLESSYKECLYYELLESGFDIKKEFAQPLTY